MPKARTEKSVRVGKLELRGSGPLFFIAGLCVLESESMLLQVGRSLKAAFKRAGARWILKCSFDKANRSSGRSFRGPGLSKSLEAFARVKAELGVPFLTDVHDAAQAEAAAKVADVLQIPAFLCRQTDLLLAAGRTGAAVNIKKGQFLAPWDIRHAVEKVESTGNRRILLTDRGTSFGYGNLVADMRGLRIMAETGYPVVFDCTHACQLPGSLGHATGGDRSFAPLLARSAVAAGAAGIFFEAHPNPDRALSDGPNSLRLSDVPRLARVLSALDKIVKRDL
ncbi:MAG: 3-deoxy-8-phosphooctulonate synthase [Elusimicrobiota bacterium]|jgi:2-dehydro-3-deoxyphosphooctonate aldolase (KDO 8-P synthase)